MNSRDKEFALNPISARFLWAMQPNDDVILVRLSEKNTIRVPKMALEACADFFKSCNQFNSVNEVQDRAMPAVDLSALILPEEIEAVKSILTFSIYKEACGSMEIPTRLFRISVPDLVSLIFLCDVLQFSTEIEEEIQQKVRESVDNFPKALWFLDLCASKLTNRPVLESHLLKLCGWDLPIQLFGLKIDFFKYFFTALYLFQAETKQELVSIVRLSEKIALNLKTVPKEILDSKNATMKNILPYFKILVALAH